MSTGPSDADVITKVEEFVQKTMAANDASHDFYHVSRVRGTAVRLAEEEGVEDVAVVEVAALLHDVFDHKYSGSDTKSSEAAQELLDSLDFAPARTAVVREIIDNVSFSTELGKGPGAPPPRIEVAVVQDADRLDAIGAIGVARTIVYGATRGRELYTPGEEPRLGMTKEEYKAHAGCTINHFYEKLFLLKDKMKTAAGRRTAEGRHVFMQQFVEQFKAEWEGLR